MEREEYLLSNENLKFPTFCGSTLNEYFKNEKMTKEILLKTIHDTLEYLQSMIDLLTDMIRENREQAGIQVGAVFITLAISFVGGIIGILFIIIIIFLIFELSLSFSIILSIEIVKFAITPLNNVLKSFNSTISTSSNFLLKDVLFLQFFSQNFSS